MTTDTIRGSISTSAVETALLTAARSTSELAEGRSRSREPSREAQAEAEGRRPTGLSLCHNGPQLPSPTYAWEELEDSTIGFRGRAAVELAAAFWPDVAQHRIRQKPYRNLGPVTDPAMVDRALVIAPGMIQLRVFDPRSKDPANANSQAEEDDEIMALFRFDQEYDELTDDDDDHGSSGIVTEFSAASKRRLGRLIASVDWPEVIHPGHRLALITLTMPGGDWRQWCPTPDAFYSLLRRFEKRYQRATGRRLSAVWKREFQRRKAPHYHLLAPLPATINGQPVQQWISQTWFKVVGSSDERHLNAGTGVDWSEGLRMSDANRAAAYFTGYTTNKDKSYQDEAPDDWRNANGSIGRWWGTLGLEVTTAERRITDTDIINTKRLLRRAIAAQKRTKKVTTKRVSRETGEVTYRTSNRRYRLRSLNGGHKTGCTYLTNDGPALAIAIARALHPPTDLWPPGQPWPLP